MININNIIYQMYCPICGKELRVSKTKKYWCGNGCYSVNLGFYQSIDFTLFDHSISIYKDNETREEKQEKMQQIVDLIKYFKEDDRYLTEIVAGSGQNGL
jgi:C4-type Zn-finger protein